MEDNLIKQAKSGEVQAFEELVAQYEKTIYNIAYRYFANEHDAVDAMQEVFIKIYRSISGFQEQSSFRTWIYRITVNTCLDLLKKNRRIQVVSIEEEKNSGLEQQLADSNGEPEQALEQKELRKSVEEAVMSLRPEYRGAVALRFAAGLTYAEIAEVLGIDEGTVKSRISRGRRKVCEILRASGNLSAKYSSDKTEGRML